MGVFELEGTWWMTADRDAVWAVVSDLPRWKEWWAALDEVEELEPGVDGQGVGRTLRLTFESPMPRTLTMDVEVVTFEPPGRIAVTAPRGGLQGDGEMTVAEQEGATRVDYSWEVRTTSLWLRPIETVLRRAMQGNSQTFEAAGERLARMAGGEPLEGPPDG